MRINLTKGQNLYAGQEATVRTGHGTTDWFQIGKGVCQGCIREGNGTPLQYSCMENPMDGGLLHCTGGSDQDHPQEKEMKRVKIVV